MNLEMEYTSIGQDKSENEDFIIIKKEYFTLQSEHLSSIEYNSHTKMLNLEFESGKTMEINIRNIDTLWVRK